MSVGTVSDYTVRPIVWESLTNLSCWVGWLWELYEGWEVVRGGGLCAGRFTLIELSLSSDPGRLKHQFSICVKLVQLSLREMGRGKVRGKGVPLPRLMPLLTRSSLLLSMFSIASTLQEPSLFFCPAPLRCGTIRLASTAANYFQTK